MSILASLITPCTRRLSVNGWKAVSVACNRIHMGFLSALLARPSSLVPVVESLLCESIPTRQPVPQTWDRTHKSSSFSILSLTPSSNLLTRRIPVTPSTVGEGALLKPSSVITTSESHGSARLLGCRRSTNLSFCHSQAFLNSGGCNGAGPSRADICRSIW